jgi:hypothetical protein
MTLRDVTKIITECLQGGGMVSSDLRSYVTVQYGISLSGYDASLEFLRSSGNVRKWRGKLTLASECVSAVEDADEAEAELATEPVPPEAAEPPKRSVSERLKDAWLKRKAAAALNSPLPKPHIPQTCDTCHRTDPPCGYTRKKTTCKDCRWQQRNEKIRAGQLASWSSRNRRATGAAVPTATTQGSLAAV